MKLGKRDPIKKPTVDFGRFLTTLPAKPIVDIIPAYSYPMDGNDTIGDCVVAGWDHSRQIITGLLTGTPVNFTEDEIIAFYKTQNPNFPAQDNGMDIQTFLEYLVSTKQILAFGKVNYLNESELKAAIYLGLSVVTGVQLQQAQMDSFHTGKWDYKQGSPVIGGHCIPLAGYTSSRLSAVSWGRTVACTEKFVQEQMDEAWFLLMQEHVDHPGFRDHFDLKGFADAIYQITEGKVIVPSPATLMFTKDLYYGMTDPDVQVLQRRLSTEPSSDGGMCYRFLQNGQLYFSNVFGKNTRDAVIRYQSTHGITPDAGYVGPTTRAALNGASAKSLVDAMIQVESGGDDKAEGDKTLANHAYGCLQIRQGVVDSVNSYLGTKHKAQECLGNRTLSLLIFSTYWKVFPQFVSNEDKAKCWNGGPGWKSLYGKPGYEKYTANLDAYWARVQKALSTP